jgi:hypothetical protein
MNLDTFFSEVIYTKRNSFLSKVNTFCYDFESHLKRGNITLTVECKFSYQHIEYTEYSIEILSSGKSVYLIGNFGFNSLYNKATFQYQEVVTPEELIEKITSLLTTPEEIDKLRRLL